MEDQKISQKPVFAVFIMLFEGFCVNNLARPNFDLYRTLSKQVSSTALETNSLLKTDGNPFRNVFRTIVEGALALVICPQTLLVDKLGGHQRGRCSTRNPWTLSKKSLTSLILSTVPINISIYSLGVVG